MNHFDGALEPVRTMAIVADGPRDVKGLGLALHVG
jgi:hypothetical protein